MQSYNVEYLYQYYVKLIVEIFAKVYITILPLWVFLLSRGVTLNVFFKTMVSFYFIIGVLAIMFTYIYGGEKIKEFFTGEKFWRNKK
jgi:hypothetical protein